MNAPLVVIDDDPDIHRALQSTSEALGLELHGAMDGTTGITKVRELKPAVVVLDLGLPGMGGMDVCRELRKLSPSLPIVILTSRNDELSKVLALELGADDYVVKPFSVPEVTARIRAIFRRTGNAQSQTTDRHEPIQIADLSVDITHRIVRLRGETITLSAIEFDLLAFLVANIGRPFTREQLTEQVWGYHCTGFDGTVTTYISRLREKIEDDRTEPRYCLTVRGYGYRFVDPLAPT